MKKTIRKIIPNLIAFITRRERYLPDIKWGENTLLTSYIFRAWEWLAWRPFGPNGVGDTIRREMAASHDPHTGKTTVAFYTLEAAIAHFEGEIRAALKTFRFPKIQVYVPVLQPAGMPFRMPIGMPEGYLFAIARDTHVDGHAGGSSLTSINWNHTCSGSNRLLAVFAGTEKSPGTDVTGMTYNSVSMTTCGVNSTQYSNTHRIFGYYLIAPATGTNSIVVTHASSCYSEGGISMSYTGAKQSGQPDAAIAISEQFGTSASTTLTTIADNCWIVACGRMDNGGTRALTGVLTALDISAGDTAQVYGDSNGALTPAGGKSVGLSSTVSDEPNGVFFSIAPLVNIEYNQTVTATAVALVSISDIASFLKTLTVTALATASLIKQAQKTITTTAQATVSQIKQLYKELEVTALGEAIINASRVFLQALTATASAVVSITKQEETLVTLEVTAAATATVSMIKSFIRTISATASATASIVNGYTLSKVLEVTASATVSITKGLVLSMELIVTAVGVATTTVQKALSMTISVVASGIARLVRDFGYTDKYPRNEVDYEDKYPTNSEY